MYFAICKAICKAILLYKCASQLDRDVNEARTLEAEAEAEAGTLEAEAEARTLEAEARTLEAKAEAIQFWPSKFHKF